MKKLITTLIIGLVTFVLCASCGQDVSKETSTESIPVASVTNASTTTVTTTSTTITTTMITTTTKAVVTTSPITTVVETEPVTTPLETEVVTEAVYEPVVQSDLPITESERIMLCNLVGREYGSDYVSIPEKAKVVAVVMNRVNSPLFPDSIYEVLVQPNQFPGYLPCDYYMDNVTDSVIQAVDYYFSHSSEFEYKLYFEGDGTWNYFS